MSASRPGLAGPGSALRQRSSSLPLLFSRLAPRVLCGRAARRGRAFSASPWASARRCSPAPRRPPRAGRGPTAPPGGLERGAAPSRRRLGPARVEPRGWASPGPGPGGSSPAQPVPPFPLYARASGPRPRRFLPRSGPWTCPRFPPSAGVTGRCPAAGRGERRFAG